MSGAKIHLTPTPVVYLYDGAPEGLFCCVYESIYGKELPCAITPAQHAQPSLFPEKTIATDPLRAQRVRDSIITKISRDALTLIETVFLSCLKEKELAILHFLLTGYKAGPAVLSMLGHPDVAPLLKAQKHLCGESQLLKGFIRFSDYDGLLFAEITPKNFVLPFIAGHFAGRFPGERFIIYDKTHQAALVYKDGQRRIVPMDEVRPHAASETEAQYRALWRGFYNAIAIKERINPKLRSSHMPKRYWENMTEMQDESAPPPPGAKKM